MMYRKVYRTVISVSVRCWACSFLGSYRNDDALNINTERHCKMLVRAIAGFNEFGFS